MYREVFVHVDNSQHSDWAVERAIELCAPNGNGNGNAQPGRITGSHVYAARLHDIRFRQLETGLPAQFQTPEEIKRQRKVHDKLIESEISCSPFSIRWSAAAPRAASRCGASCSKASTTRSW